MSEQKWRRNYVYVKPWALQGRKIVMHALPGEGPYWPPRCMGEPGQNAILVLREHMEKIGARACKRCHAAVSPQEGDTT